MGRVVEMNDARAKALESYSSVRSYHLECHCVSHKKADMVVRTDYQAPNKKEFTIVSESGSGTVRDRVFKKLLEAEQESMREENQQRSAITPENYTFQLSDYEKTGTDEFYVLDAQPRSKNKFLFRGHIWVNAKDFAITQSRASRLLTLPGGPSKLTSNVATGKSVTSGCRNPTRAKPKCAFSAQQFSALNIAITGSPRLGPQP